MSKWKKPHKTKMILEFSDSGSNIIFRRCYNAGQGHCDHAHLSTFSSRSVEFYEGWVVMLQFAVLQSASTDILQEVEKSTRNPGCGTFGGKTENTRCIARALRSNFTEEKRHWGRQRKFFWRLSRELSKRLCPVEPVFQVGNDSSTTVTKYVVNTARAVPLRYQLTWTECTGEMWHK